MLYFVKWSGDQNEEGKGDEKQEVYNEKALITKVVIAFNNNSLEVVRAKDISGENIKKLGQVSALMIPAFLKRAIKMNEYLSMVDIYESKKEGRIYILIKS